MDFITGYQYGDKNQYIGEYQFPNNLDQDSIHMPLNTTLIEPPVEAGKQAFWDGEKWNLQDIPAPAEIEKPPYVMPVITEVVE